MCHTASYYYFGKDPTFAFGTAVPFGLNSRMQNAWMYLRRRHGADERLLQEVRTSMRFPAATPAARWAAGSARRSRTLSDFNGLKFRIGGFAGRVLTKLGGVPQQIAGGDIYPALEKGTIDAAEWVGPYDDEKLGFDKVAPYYYYPGWWEGGAMLHNFINIDKWNALPPAYKAVVRTASDDGEHLDAGEVRLRSIRGALKRLVAGGAKLHAVLRPPSWTPASRRRSRSTPRSRRPIRTSRRSTTP